jgi:hypothetical protein
MCSDSKLMVGLSLPVPPCQSIRASIEAILLAMCLKPEWHPILLEAPNENGDIKGPCMTLFDCFGVDTGYESPLKLDIWRVLWEISASEYGTSI